MIFIFPLIVRAILNPQATLHIYHPIVTHYYNLDPLSQCMLMHQVKEY